MSLEFLQSTKLFSGVASEILERIAHVFEEKKMDKGQSLFLQGEEAKTLYFLASGECITVFRNAEDGLEYRGREISEGDELGLEAVWLGESYPFSLHAKAGASFFALDREYLMEICTKSSAICKSMMSVLTRRLQEHNTQKQSTVVDLAKVFIDREILAKFPRKLILKHKMIPLVQRKGIIVIGFVNPGVPEVLEELERYTGDLRIRSVTLDAVSFERFYRVRISPILDRRSSGANKNNDDRWFDALKEKVYDVELLEKGEKLVAERVGEQVKGEEVIELMNRVIGEALDLQASDIHIEPSEDLLVIRYRVDGRLKRRPEELGMRFHAPLVTRIKVLGRMDIAERRQAQDGRLSMMYNNRQIDFRLSTVPTHFGEKMVMRILDPSNILMDLEKLVPHERTYRAIRWMIEQPQGLVLIAGPTGSGKTTTIYSTLLFRREDEVNIVTIEDPVEYTIGGIAQVQVNDLAGVSFANSIRHFLRQDPDIITVGETRDPTTASTALEAALTGHLVITSIHANSALGSIVRLRDMGIEPFLIANTLNGVISQRLVRRVCPHCRGPRSYHHNLIQPLGIFSKEEEKEFYTFYKGKGCIHCNFLGYRGRVGAFEFLQIDEGLRPLIAGDATIEEIAQKARKDGNLQTIKSFCRELLLNGITTPEEVTRILFADS